VTVLHVFVAATVKLQEFVMKKQISPSEQEQVTTPVETSMFVPMTRYAVSVTS